MQHLDLTTDAPSEFEGRVVSLRGCEYVIGPSFREDDQGFAHLLTNRESGLCLHVIQVRPEYMTDPDMALAASKHKAEVTSKFRSQMRLKQPGVAIPTISVVEAHGGSFELHEGRWGLFSSGLDKEPGIEIFNEAVGILESGDALAAEARIRSLLGGSPRHTEALSLLADCLDDQGKSAEALEVMWQINAIEPNASRYQGRTVFYSLKAPPRSSAIAEFEALKNRFPLVDDYNIYGIEAYLGCAMIEKARELLDASVLDDDTRKELQTRVDEALAVDTAYKIIDAKVASKDYPDDPGGYADLVAELEPLLQRYPENPWIQANLGFTMAAAGKPEQAVSLLSDAAGGLTPILSAYCYANAGFALVEMEKWNLALSSFNLS
ncbi:MAG TPA: tetratricopeptide repeat protein, partial [Gammaproteobacteria bacterium]|nr:tetratricopeptide repeat protein [Gammaproteobacteria bacterium]